MCDKPFQILVSVLDLDLASKSQSATNNGSAAARHCSWFLDYGSAAARHCSWYLDYGSAAARHCSWFLDLETTFKTLTRI